MTEDCPVTVEQWDEQFEPAWPVRHARGVRRVWAYADNGFPHRYGTAMCLIAPEGEIFGGEVLSGGHTFAVHFDHAHYTKVIKTRYKEAL